MRVGSLPIRRYVGSSISDMLFSWGLFGCLGDPSGERLILQEGGKDPQKRGPNFHIRGVFNPRVATFSQTGSGKTDGGCDSGRRSRGKGKGRNADV